MLTFGADGTMTIGERVPGGYVFVDGSGVGDIGPAVMRDRETLARDGLVIVNAIVDRDTRVVVGEPEIVSRGFVFHREAEELFENARQTVRRVLESPATNGNRVELVQDALGKLFYNETKRRPMIFAFVNEV
jgi:ribonuclease J